MTDHDLQATDQVPISTPKKEKGDRTTEDEQDTARWLDRLKEDPPPEL